FKEALAQINREVQEGHTLSGSMERQSRFFDERYVKAVRLGEVTGTIDVQLRRLAAGERFDFEGDDNLEHFTAESPTIAELAAGTIENGIKYGMTEIQILRPHPEILHEIYLRDGICQEVWGYSGAGQGRPEKYIATPLFNRFKML